MFFDDIIILFYLFNAINYHYIFGSLITNNFNFFSYKI